MDTLSGFIDSSSASGGALDSLVVSLAVHDIASEIIFGGTLALVAAFE